MKKKFVYLFIAALMVGLVGCKPEQSELDFGSLQEKALVTGRVTYSLGQDTLSDDYVAERILPAVGRKIYVEVPMSSYQAGSQGNKIFTGVVDSLGNFSIEVPVKSEGISGATLRYEEFTAERATYLKMENGKPVFEVRMCKFETPAAIASLPTLMPGSNHIGEEADLRYDYTIIDMKDYSETAVFTGKLLLPYEVSYHTGAYKPAADCTIEITIKDGEDVEEQGYSNASSFTYGCTTDKNGIFTLNLPIKNLRKGFCIEDATVVPSADAAFVHYTDVTGKSVKVAGAYKLRTDWVAGANIYDVAEVIEGIECSIGECPLKFVPGYNNGIVDEVLPPAWNDDLAGWVFGEQAFADMTATIKLTGSVKLAQEDAYAVGSYTTSAQSVLVSGDVYPYNKAFAVLTQADGTFELEIPIEQEGVKPDASWTVELIQPAAIAFTHYESVAKSIVIKEGSYNLNEKLRASDAEWNQLGDFYFTFTPASAPDTWTDYLAGWVLKEDYNATVTLTAKIYLAKESALAVGEYKGAEGHRAIAYVNYPDGDNKAFVVPVKADGTVSVAIPAKEAKSKYESYSIELLDTEVEYFQHYTKKGVEEIAGKYYMYEDVEDKDAEWNNKWTYYYKFNPNTPPTPWYENLAAWVVVEGYKYSATATGKAMFAKEDSYAKGSYKAATNEVVTVTAVELPGLEFQVPVKNDGSFSVKLPLKDAQDEYKLAVSADNVTIDDFVHYRDHGKTKTLSGEYQVTPLSPIKAANATWTDLGTYYFKFNPSDYVATYESNLYGWQKYDESKFANKDMSISGTIKLAAETDFWKGTYVAYAKKKVRVTYHLHNVDFNMVVLSNEDGYFDCQAYRQFGDDAPVVTATPVETNVTDYVHYYHATSPATEKLEGNYNHYKTDKAATAKWNVVGTKYYKFTPTSSSNDWSNRLVGWYVVPQKKDNAQIKLYAQKAYETTSSENHEASWTNADKVKATVNVDGQVFDLLVSGKNIAFTMPVAETIEDGATTFYISVDLENETGNTTQFTHYPDPNANATEILVGNYRNMGNLSYESVVADGKKFEILESAKMMFYDRYNNPPAGYTWDITAEHDAN